MRIEYEGTIEAQPPFQHVGYVSAGLVTDRSIEVPRGALLGAALLSVALMAALVARRQRRLPRIWVPASVAACLLAAVAAWSFTHAGYPSTLYRTSSLTPPYAKTLLEMERLIVQTDALCRELGRTPSGAEWQRSFGGERDGWGEPYFYDPAARDKWPTELGRDYMICSFRGRSSDPGEHDPFYVATSIQSAWLGPDGVVATEDDYPMMPGRREVQAGGRAGLEKLAAELPPGGETWREPLAPGMSTAESVAGGDS